MAETVLLNFISIIKMIILGGEIDIAILKDFSVLMTGQAAKIADGIISSDMLS
jgi:diaminopimelate epimerase